MPRPGTLDRYGSEIEAELRTTIGSARSPLFRMMHYQFGWVDQTGMVTSHARHDYVLGTLLLLTAEGCGAARKAALPAAAALELAQAAAEVQQELKDGLPGDAMRPALWWVFGNSQGINATDALYALARVKLLELGMGQAERAPLALAAAEALDRAVLDLNEASFALSNQTETAPEGYLQTLRRSAASLPACAAGLGARWAGAGAETVGALQEFGGHLGLAWALQREVDTLWHPRGVQAALIEAPDRKRTLPVLHALAHASTADLQVLEQVGARQDVLNDEELGKAVAVLERSGGRSAAETAVATHRAGALAALARANLVPATGRELEGLVAYLSEPSL